MDNLITNVTAGTGANFAAQDGTGNIDIVSNGAKARIANNQVNGSTHIIIWFAFGLTNIKYVNGK